MTELLLLMQFVRNHQSITAHTALTCINYILNIYHAWFSLQNLILTADIPPHWMFYPLKQWAFGHPDTWWSVLQTELAARCHLSTRHLIEADLTASTCGFWRPKAWGTHEIAGATVCFSRSAPPSGSLEEARTARRKEASKTFARLFLPMAAEGWTPPICPLSPVQRWDWRPWGGGGGGGGGEESISGCVCPRLDLRKGGLYVTTERGGSTCWAEAQRCGTAQQSREERSCAGETADHPSTGGTHTNKPLWLLEKYRPIPPSPSFLFLSRGLLAF